MRRLLITLTLAIALAPMSSAFADVGSTHATGTITGPKGTCVAYTKPARNAPSMGTATLDSTGYTNGSFRVSLALNDFPAGHYWIYLIDDQLDRGKPVGCASTNIGQLDVGSSGTASYAGQGYELFQSAGQHYFEILLTTSAPDSFPLNGYAAGPMALNVPEAHL